MLVQVLLISDIQFVDYDDHLWPFINEPIKDIFLETASNIKNINDIDIQNWDLFMLFEDFAHDFLLIVSG